ncbi:hypothetical protein [Yinghuangia aomiensis]|uniref:hypothetical protein n=1 Tax=Yinghuangia aomiensis TaxID=676205 RepID=UPI0031F04123
MPDKPILVSRNHHLGIAVTGPGLNAQARQLAEKAGFVTHREQDAMVLPDRVPPEHVRRTTRDLVRRLYAAGFPVTVDATLPGIPTPVPRVDLGPATAALHDALGVLNVSPHPLDTAAILDEVRTGPLAALGALLDAAVARADTLDDPEHVREARVRLHQVAESVADAETVLMDATAVLRAHPPASPFPSPPRHRRPAPPQPPVPPAAPHPPRCR